MSGPGAVLRRPPVIAALAAVLVAAIVLAVVLTGGDDDPDGASPRPTTTTSTTVAPTTTGVVATIAPTTTDPNAPPTIPSRSQGRFTIVGRDIVAPDGSIFVPVGANVAVRQGGFEEGYAFNWRGTATDRVNDVLAWGWNTVRTTLVCQPPGNPTEADLDAGIDAFIEEYTSRRVVVMVECHDLTAEDPTPDSPQVVALQRFWSRLAERWKDNPYVWFNTYNEPFEGAEPDDIEGWLELQSDALQRLRSVAPDSVFVADIPGYGQGVASFTGDNPITRLGEGQCNVLYSWHAYGAVAGGGFGPESAFDDDAASLANHRRVFEYLRDNDIPFVIGEFGDPLTLDEGNAGLPIWNRNGAKAVMQLGPEFGVGLLWWHATGDSGQFLTYSLTADRGAPWAAATTGVGLSDSGRTFWELSTAPRPAVAFQGDLSASNCP